MSALSEWESKARLGARLPRPPERLTSDVSSAVDFARQLDRTVVAKASGVAHKSEAGLVRVGLDHLGVKDCWAELAAAGDGTVLIAAAVKADLELFVGGLRDPTWGPAITVGVGGIVAEVLDDIAVVLVPAEPGELRQAVRSLRAAPLLEGYRGGVALDWASLEVVVGVVADLLMADPTVKEIDCNPVSVVNGIAVVLDALVVTGSKGA